MAYSPPGWGQTPSPENENARGAGAVDRSSQKDKPPESAAAVAGLAPLAGLAQKNSPVGSTVAVAICDPDGIDDPSVPGGRASLSMVGRNACVQCRLDHAQALGRQSVQKGLRHHPP